MLNNDLQIEYQVAGHLKKAVIQANQDFVNMLVQQIVWIMLIFWRNKSGLLN